MSSPSGLTVYNSTMPLDVTVYWSVTEPIPWLSVSLSYSIDGDPPVILANGSNVIFYSSSAVVSTSGNTVIDVSSLTRGRHTITISADGTYNLDDDFVDTLSYTFPPTPFYVNLLPSPDISILSPQNKTYHEADAMLNFTVDLPTSWMGYSIDSQKNVTLSGNSTLSGLTDGLHSIIVYANNTLGEIGSSKIVTFTVATPPKITLQSPINRTYRQPNIPLSFTLNKSVNWIGYSIDGKTNTTITSNSTLTMLPLGEHNITIYANDAFGNSVASQNVNFTVAKPLPVLAKTTIVAVSGTVTVVAVCLSFFIFNRWRRRRTI